MKKEKAYIFLIGRKLIVLFKVALSLLGICIQGGMAYFCSKADFLSAKVQIRKYLSICSLKLVFTTGKAYRCIVMALLYTAAQKFRTIANILRSCVIIGDKVVFVALYKHSKQIFFLK